MSVLHAHKSVTILQENVTHVLEIDDSTNKIVTKLRTHQELIKSSIKLLKKDEALRFMASEIDTNLIKNGINPFSDVVLFKMKADADIPLVHRELASFDGVKQVYSQDIDMDQLKNNIYKIGFFVLIAAGIFSLLSLALIFATLQLQLYANRFEIKTMELVGAEDRFIKMPYMRRAVGTANRATIFAALVLVLGFFALRNSSETLGAILDYKYLLISIISIWVIGLLFLGISTNLLTSKYLKRKMSELYN